MSAANGRPLPVIDADLCRLCARCRPLSTCKWQAIIRFDRDETPVIDASRCQRCLVCVDRCEYEAVSAR